MIGKLFIVATPIGNLNDITFRAIEVLKNVDIVLAEDTRQSKKLFSNFEISKPPNPLSMLNGHMAGSGAKNAAFLMSAGSGFRNQKTPLF